MKKEGGAPSKDSGAGSKKKIPSKVSKDNSKVENNSKGDVSQERHTKPLDKSKSENANSQEGIIKTEKVQASPENPSLANSKPPLDQSMKSQKSNKRVTIQDIPDSGTGPSLPNTNQGSAPNPNQSYPNILNDSALSANPHKKSVIANMSMQQSKHNMSDSRIRLDPNRKPRSSLVVTITNVEFVKEFHYFIGVSLDRESEKRRTEVSSAVATPIFKTNTFTIPLGGFAIQYHEFLLFSAFIVADRENEGQGTGQARLLGECKVELGPHSTHLTDISNFGARYKFFW
jgi:hypothetical protein